VLTPEEAALADLLVREGHVVEAPLESAQQGVRIADFIVDGTHTEVKSISNLTSIDPSGALARRILEGAGQAPVVVAEVSSQMGMTEDIARRAVRRAFGADTLGRIQAIRVIGLGFDFTVPRHSPATPMRGGSR
jgi:hypothetical protein